ncbi:MAG: hypothetical protein AB7T59_06870 [Hyphomonadaceae bacterium]
MFAAAAPVTHAPPLLWAAARALIATMFALFGDPSHIARQHTHNQKERKRLLAWLRAGEALMRQLLLIEASHYAKPNTRPLLQAGKLLAARKCVRRLVTFEADKPEAWRVSFRCLSDRRRLAGDRRCNGARLAGEDAGAPKKHKPHRSREERWVSAHGAPPKLTSAWPLAERAEAMLRAFNNPGPYAKRLARRLHATPHRAAELTRHPDNLPHVIAESDFALLREHTAMARRRIESG